MADATLENSGFRHFVQAHGRTGAGAALIAIGWTRGVSPVVVALACWAVAATAAYQAITGHAILQRNVQVDKQARDWATVTAVMVGLLGVYALTL